MVIGGGAFMEMQKSAAPEKAVLGQDHESAQVQRAVNDRLLDESLFVEVKGFSGAGRAISSASRAASSAGKVGRAAGDVGKTVGTAGKAAGDVGKTVGTAGKAAGDVGKAAGAVKDVPKTSVPSIDGRKPPEPPKGAVPPKDTPGTGPAARATDGAAAAASHCGFVRSYFDPSCLGWWVYGMGSGSSRARAAESNKDCSNVDPKDTAKMQQCTPKEKPKR